MDSTLVNLIHSGSIYAISVIKDNAPLLWETMKHRELVQSIIVLIGCCIMVVPFIATFVIVIHSKRNKEYIPDIRNNEEVFMVLFVLTPVIAVVSIMVGIGEIIDLFSLDGAALERIMNMIK